MLEARSIQAVPAQGTAEWWGNREEMFSDVRS